MKVTESGVAIDDVVAAIKRSIKQAGISNTDVDRDLRVTSIRLVLNALAVQEAGVGVDFRIPFIGMALKVGGTVSRRETHQIEVKLVPPDLRDEYETRDTEVEDVLVNAIQRIRSVIILAAGGDDPFILEDSAVDLSFALTADGTITFGFNGELKDQVTHTLRVEVVAPQPDIELAH
jgi:Trypsin-co-occurring domain 2